MIEMNQNISLVLIQWNNRMDSNIIKHSQFIDFKCTLLHYHVGWFNQMWRSVILCHLPVTVWLIYIKELNNQQICDVDYWTESPLEKVLFSQTADENEVIYISWMDSYSCFVIRDRYTFHPLMRWRKYWNYDFKPIQSCIFIFTVLLFSVFSE